MSNPFLKPDSLDREDERTVEDPFAIEAANKSRPTADNALAAFGSEGASVRHAAGEQRRVDPPASDDGPSDGASTAALPPVPESAPANPVPARTARRRQRSLAIAPLWLAVAAVGGAAAGIVYARYFLPSSVVRQIPPPTVSVTAPSPPINPQPGAAPNEATPPAALAAPPDQPIAQPPATPSAPTSETRADRERARQQRAIRSLLETYRQAYERLDVPAVAALWPEVDVRALERTFSTLSHQQVTFDRCEITITDAEAVARCDGSLVSTPTGDTEGQSRQTTWVFALQRATAEWRISGVNAR